MGVIILTINPVVCSPYAPRPARLPWQGREQASHCAVVPSPRFNAPVRKRGLGRPEGSRDATVLVHGTATLTEASVQLGQATSQTLASAVSNKEKMQVKAEAERRIMERQSYGILNGPFIQI